MQKLAKSWQRLPLLKKRCENGEPWLRWQSDSSEDRGESCIEALQHNCPVIARMFEHLQSLDPPPIKPLIFQVTCLNIL